MPDRNLRWFALAGPAGVVVALVSVFIGGSAANEKDSAAAVLAFYDDKLDQGRLASFLWIVAAALLVLFAAYLRTALRSASSSFGDTAALAAFGGGVVLGVGLLNAVNDNFALISAVDQKDALTTKTLNIVSNQNWPIFVAGMAVLLFAGGLAVLSSHALPAWLGWVGVVAGVVGVLGPGGFVALLVGMLWIIVAGVMLFLRSGPKVPNPVPTGSTPQV